MHEGDHVNEVRFCFNLGSFFMYSGLCLEVKVGEQGKKKTKKGEKRFKALGCAPPWSR